MAFSLFTKRTEYTSKRLRFIARGLQVFGVLAGMATAAAAIVAARGWMSGWPDSVRDAYVRQNVLGAIGFCVSYFVIGRALLQRQRIGAYVAVATIGLPLIYGAMMMAKISHYLPSVFYAVKFGIPLLTLAGIASIWRELGSVRDSEFAKHGSPPEPFVPLTPRNRGFGEGRAPRQELALNSASLEPMPFDTNKPHAEKVSVAAAAQELDTNS